jgi:hypothetical protein
MIFIKTLGFFISLTKYNKERDGIAIVINIANGINVHIISRKSLCVVLSIDQILMFSKLYIYII